MKLIATLIAICSWPVFLMHPFNAAGQAWMKEIKDKKNPGFFEVRQSFNNYWKGKVPAGKGTLPRGQGYKQFKRWEWFWEPRVGREGVFPRASVVMEEWGRYLATHPGVKKPAPPIKSLSPKDPVKGKGSGAAPEPASLSPGSSGGWVPLGPASSTGGYGGLGRLGCIGFHPTDPNTFWVGSPAGGLWKTTTGGASWTTLTDNLPVLGVSALVIDPANTSILYIATGDRNPVGHTNSVGILKSTDGGTSWNATGLSFEASDRIRIRGLIMHPANPLYLLAATSTGIYRTLDGGAAWTLEQAGDFQEILFKPGSPATVYASADNPTAQIFRSVNTGDTWSQVTSFSGINRIALAVSAAKPAVVGALCTNSTDSGFGGYYTSTNSGASFSLTYAAGDVNLLNHDRYGAGGGGQGWYNLCLAISPANASVIYAGGVNTWKSTDGGKTWAIISMWYAGWEVPTVHADKHYMAFNPLSPGTLYQCNDGGLYKTSDAGLTWTDLSNGLGITQFYRMGNSATNAALTIAGAQDNGTKLRNASVYQDVIGGDGMEAIIDYTDAKVMYGSYQSGKIHKSTDGGASFSDISGALPPGAWVTPYVMDPVNPRILYAGVGGNVYKTTDGGSTWAAISSSLNTNELQTLAVAPGNTQTIYTGSYYELYKTTDGGASWSAITMPAFNAITAMEVHPTNPEIVWVTASGYNAGNTVYRTDDGGVSWTNISGTLPALPANTIEYDKNTGVLYLGNDVGVFVRAPGMSDWQLFDTGLPNVVVTELEIQYGAGLLRAATFGRGLWESPLFQTPTVSTLRDFRFGGSAIDNFTTAIKTSDGGYLLGGFSLSPVSGDKTMAGRGGNDYWLVKVSSTGAKQWNKRYGGTGHDYLSAIIQTSDGGYLVGGNSLSGKGSEKSQSSRGGRDYWIVKVSSTGARQWDKRFGGAGDDELRSLILLSTGEYLLAGVSSSGAGGDRSEASQGGQDYWILKVSSTGARLWDKRFGGASNDNLEAAIPTPDGGYLLGGRSASGISGNKTEASQGGNDYWMVKVSSTGVKQWDKRFGGAAADDLFGLAPTGDGHYVLAGTSASGISGDKTEASQGGNDYWMVKVSSTGARLWDKRFGGAASDDLRSLIATAEGGYLLGGRSDSGSGGDKTQPGQGLTDYWIVKLGSTGAIEWDKRFGGTAAEELRTVLQTNGGGYLLGGRSDSGISGDKTQPSQGQTDYWMVELGGTGIGASMAEISEASVIIADRSLEVIAPEKEESMLHASPNPFTNKVKLKITLTRREQVSLKVYDDQGSEVANLYEGEGEPGKHYTLEWYAGQQKAGIYMVRLATTGKVITRKVVLFR